MTIVIENRMRRKDIQFAQILHSFYMQEVVGTWIPILGGESASNPELEFQREKAAFEQQLPALKRQYQGKYVAVHNGKVEENASSEMEVVQRFFKRFGDTHVYIGYVGDTPPDTYQVSPISSE